MDYQAKDLPFDKKPLGRISEKTLEVHHDKLYVGYVNKKNEIETKLRQVEPQGNATYSEFRGLKLEQTFAANGVYLHERYFKSLGGNGEMPAGAFQDALEREWGSIENWKKSFVACGMSARGWVVLAYDFNDDRLHNYIGDMHNQGGVWGAMPLFVLDVYEHAYFMDFGSDRAAYIEDFLANADYSDAAKKYEKALKVSEI